MLNFLYPQAINRFVDRAIKRLSKSTQDATRKKLIDWLKTDCSSAPCMDCLPNDAPEWAFNASEVHGFVPSDETKQSIKRLAALMKELEKASLDKDAEWAASYAKAFLKGVAKMSFDEMQKKLAHWEAHPHRRLRLKRAVKQNSHNQVVSHDGYMWVKCHTLDDVHHVGKVLHNCLTYYYDSAFQNGESIIYVLRDPHSKLVAAAAIEDDVVVEFESGSTDEQHRDELTLSLASHLVTLCQTLKLHIEPEYFAKFGCWENGPLDDPYCTVGEFSFYLIENETKLLIYHSGSVEGTAFKLDDDIQSIERPGFESVRLSRLACRALCEAVNTGKLPALDLEQFEELSDYEGMYYFWDDHPKCRKVETQVGHIILTGQEARWIEAPVCKDTSAVLWYSARFDVDDNNSYLEPWTYAALLTQVEDTYLHKPGRFWSNLKEHLCLPDLYVNDEFEPVIQFTFNECELLAPHEAWQRHSIDDEGVYCVFVRPVDDYRDTIVTEQWICTDQDGTPLAGLLKRQVSERKSQLHIQAPGRDPVALAELLDSQTYNRHSSVLYDEGQVFDGKRLIDILLPTRDGSPIYPQHFTAEEGGYGTWRDRFYLFDHQQKVALVARITDEHVLKDPTEISLKCLTVNQLVALLSQTGYVIDPSFDNILEPKGYRVSRHGVITKRQTHEVTEKEDWICLENYDSATSFAMVLYPQSPSPDDESTWTKLRFHRDDDEVGVIGRLPDDDSLDHAHNYIVPWLEEHELTLSTWSQKVLGLQYTNTGIKRRHSKAPTGWYYQDGAWFYEPQLATDFNEPRIKVTPTEVSMPHQDFDLIEDYQDHIRLLLNWLQE